MSWLKIRERFGIKYLEAATTFFLVFFIFVPLLHIGLYPKSKKRKQTKKKLLLYGAYGNLSIGDDAILQSILENLDNIKYSITISSFRPEVTAAKVKQNVLLQGRTLDGLFYIHKELKTTDVLIFGGGGVLETHNNSFRTTMIMVYKLSKVFYAKFFGVKVFCFAIGSNTKKYSFLVNLLVKTCLKVSECVTTRDPKSKAFLLGVYSKANIKALADPALLLSPSKLKKNIKTAYDAHFKIGINVMPYYKLLNGDKSKLDSIRLELTKTINYFIDKYNAHIIFAPMVDIDDTNEDDALIENIIKKNNISVLNPIGTPEMYMDNLVDADVFLGTRLHSNILVYNCGVPIIGLAYHDKINSFFDYVGMSDFKESIFELSSKKLIEDIEFVLSNRQTVFIKMNTNRKKLIELAQQTFYELEKVIN